MNGRLYKWPLGSDNKLVTSNEFVNPAEVYYMNERNVQGIGPDMTQNSSGNYTSNSFWLATTKSSGELMKVSTGAAASPVYTYSSSQMPFAPEGLHSTLTSGHLWIVTEGETGVTNPANGGRVLISIDVASIEYLFWLRVRRPEGTS
jgi:hypothetical protein